MKIRKSRVSREVRVEDAADMVELSYSVQNPEEIFARTERKVSLERSNRKAATNTSECCELHDLQEHSLHEIAEARGIFAAAKARFPCTTYRLRILVTYRG